MIKLVFEIRTVGIHSAVKRSIRFLLKTKKKKPFFPQIVCGILAVVMGSVACIEEKGSFGNLGLGIPTGLSTVLAAGTFFIFLLFNII